MKFVSQCFSSEQLQEQENEQEVLNCYATALKFFGQDSAILNELGTFFAK